jgi:quercetin dioxygenase-like cupin family protein
MDRATFEKICHHEGYLPVEERSAQPDFTAQPHTHPFSVRGLVLAGEFGLIVDGEHRRYRAGEAFSLAAECEHAESFGPEGATYLIGRKQPA